MRLQRLVEGVDAHSVGGREQRELLVDDGLYRGNPVAVASGRVDALLQGEIGIVELSEPSLHVGHAVAQFAFEAACRAVHDLLVGQALLPFVLRVEVVGVRLEKNAEHAAVARREVLHDRLQRVVTLRERRVFAAQAVRRVLHLVFERRVEEEREADVVEYGGSQPHEQVDRRAGDALFAAAAFAQACQILLPGHLRAFRNWFRADFP